MSYDGMETLRKEVIILHTVSRKRKELIPVLRGLERQWDTLRAQYAHLTR